MKIDQLSQSCRSSSRSAIQINSFVLFPCQDIHKKGSASEPRVMFILTGRNAVTLATYLRAKSDLFAKGALTLPPVFSNLHCKQGFPFLS